MSNENATCPTNSYYFEDYVVGAVHECGSLKMDEGELLDFARRFDPQPFHTDPELAKHSIYGGLIASGWHTSALMMRMLVDNYLSPASSIGSPGVDELRWLLPVRPGDELSLRVTVAQTKRSSSKPDRGIIHSFVEVLNQKGEVVMTMKAVNFILCRPG
jgi:acyl dehydratase